MHYIHLFHPYNILKHNYFFYKQFVLPIILSLDKLDLTKAYNINNRISIPKLFLNTWRYIHPKKNNFTSHSIL